MQNKQEAQANRWLQDPHHAVDRRIRNDPKYSADHVPQADTP